jgi:hypothetical protein
MADEDKIAALLKKTPLTVPQAGEVFGLPRNSAYEAAKRGDFEVVKFGKRMVVPTAPLRRKLGLAD